MKKHIWHPPARKLALWLDGEDDARVDAHVASCERCATKIENIDASEVSLRDQLLHLLQPPSELDERLRRPIDTRMRGREDLSLISELFGLPIRAARVMSTSTIQGDT